MKRCPICRNIYTDDSLFYCLQDGTKLAVMSDSASSAGTSSGSRDLPATEILKPEDMPTAKIEVTPPTKEQGRARPTAVSGSQLPPSTTDVPGAKSNAAVIALSVIVAVLLVAVGGLITWIAMRDRGQTPQQPSRVLTENSNQNTGQANANAANTTATPRANTNANATANTTPQPSPVDVAAAQREVQAAMNTWAGTVRQRNLEEHVKQYADVLDYYYNATNVSRDRVRTDRSTAFSRYTSMEIELSNVKIEIDPTGTRAVATFDKTYDFRNEEKSFNGSGLNRFWFVKEGGRWRITGERELKNYYTNK